MIDPVENNLFDLPDYEHTHDETFQPLLPPDSPGGAAEGALLNGDPEGNQLTQNKDSSVTTRRAVKRTIPKLDAQSPATEEPVFLPETQNSPKESGSPSLSPALTEEQQQRIERNRQRALERRQAKNQLSQSPNDDLPTSEEYGTIAAQEKDEVCIDKAGVPFQPTEDVRSSTDQVSF
ncbi:hypothetical protein E2320_013589 [Naja naja]|nr:hypothetical protein E2320_013589 [Naja naja]